MRNAPSQAFGTLLHIFQKSNTSPIAEFECGYDRTKLELPIYFADISYLEFLQNYLR
ncbi:MAG: hypothetical protein V7K39_22665 [Nostoc sp.]